MSTKERVWEARRALARVPRVAMLAQVDGLLVGLAYGALLCTVVLTISGALAFGVASCCGAVACWLVRRRVVFERERLDVLEGHAWEALGRHVDWPIAVVDGRCVECNRRVEGLDDDDGF